MVSKDQAIGGAILAVCVIIALGYIIALFGYSWIYCTLNWSWLPSIEAVSYWLIAAPVFIAFVAILFIGAWIGWTMATTPPPKPIEEITTEIEDKKEEPKAEEPAPEAPAEEKPVNKKKR
jgi:TRAP-type C4-dicarboxylate transport system permease small subunit